MIIPARAARIQPVKSFGKNGLVSSSFHLGGAGFGHDSPIHFSAHAPLRVARGPADTAGRPKCARRFHHYKNVLTVAPDRYGDVPRHHTGSGTFADFKSAFTEGGDVRASLHRLEAIAGQLGRQANENTEALGKAVAAAGKNFGDTAGSVKQTGENIAATSAAILAAAGNTAQTVQGIAAHISAMDTLTAKLGGVVEKNTESHHEWAATIAPAIHSLTENAKSLTEVIPPLAEVSKSFADSTRQIEDFAKRITSAGEEHTKRFGMTADRIETMGAEIATTQREFLTGIGAALGAQAAEIGRHLAIAGEMQAKRFETAALAFERTGAEIATGQREFLAGLQPVLVELPRQVIEMARQQVAQTEKIAGMLAGLRQGQANRGEHPPEKPRRGFFRRLIFWRR